MKKVRLYDLAQVIRSKNSGPFQTTLDAVSYTHLFRLTVDMASGRETSASAAGPSPGRAVHPGAYDRSPHCRTAGRRSFLPPFLWVRGL